MNIYDSLIYKSLFGGSGGGGGGGSSDFSTAQVTLVKGDPTVDIVLVIPIASQEESIARATVYLTETTTVTALLYKGAGEVWSSDANVVEVEGNATIDDGAAIITGDCTVTFE